MNIITQDLRFRQSVVKYYFRNGATATAAQYKVSRKTVYRWVNKYDGTIKSLANESFYLALMIKHMRKLVSQMLLRNQRK